MIHNCSLHSLIFFKKSSIVSLRMLWVNTFLTIFVHFSNLILMRLYPVIKCQVNVKHGKQKKDGYNVMQRFHLGSCWQSVNEPAMFFDRIVTYGVLVESYPLKLKHGTLKTSVLEFYPIESQIWNCKILFYWSLSPLNIKIWKPYYIQDFFRGILRPFKHKYFKRGIKYKN